MLEFAAPVWLLGLPVLALVWWLHRLRNAGAPIPVAALFLWRHSRQRSASGLILARRADPLWWLRAAIVAAILTALAEPQWLTRAAPIVVWMDDSISMQALEGEVPRWQLASDALSAALDSVDTDEVTLRSLSDPAALLRLNGARSAWPAAIAGWFAQRAFAEPWWPTRSELVPDARHWIVADGADPATPTWIAAMPIERIVQVGARTDNLAITRLAVRSALHDPLRWQGLVEVSNASAQTLTTDVELRVGADLHARWPLSLPPNATLVRSFEIAASVAELSAELTASDALAGDGRLTLALPEAQVSTRIAGPCGPSLRQALNAHPRLAFGATTAGLRVNCATDRPGLSVPTLWVHPGERAAADPSAADALVASTGHTPATLTSLFLESAWITPLDAGPVDGQTWLALGERQLVVYEPGLVPMVHVLFDLEDPELIAQPEYPILVSALLTALHPPTALDQQQIASRDRAASVVSPATLALNDATGTQTQSAGGDAIATAPIHLQALPLAVAVLLLLLDSAVLLTARNRHLAHAAARLGLAGILAVALLWPGPFQRQNPRDLLVLWDDSSSMDRAELQLAWAALGRLAATLPPHSRGSVIRFGVSAQVEAPYAESVIRDLAQGAAPQRTTRLDRSGTDLVAALERGLRTTDPARPTAIALISDGRMTSSAAQRERGAADTVLERARNAGIPIYAFTPVVAAAATLRVHAPDRATAGKRVPIDVSLASPEPTRGRLSLLLDDAVVATADIDLTAQRETPIRFWLTATQPGAKTLRVHWASAAGSLEREHGLQVLGEVPWLMVAREGEADAGGHLRAAGWSLTSVTPEELPAYADRLGDAAGLVLNDIAIADLPAAAWSALNRAVTERGTPLLVLGGPRSFGAGGYRHSDLEGLLPVTAQVPDPRAVSAVLFMVDSSGSMGRSFTHLHPMGYAQRAVLETVRTLGAEDQLGVVAFDVQARTILPLAAYPDPIAAVEGLWTTLGPAGGTRLRPALQAAIAELGQSALSRRLLVLVTDGFLAQEDVKASVQALQAEGIELLVLAVGREADVAALRELAGADNVFRVDQVSELPTLMRSEVERRRHPMHEGPTTVRVRRALPQFASSESLPSLAGVMRTRPKSSATVYLEADFGDPLLAAHHAGAGRVAVLPAGLGEWARAWTGSAQWPEFAAALDAWLADRSGAAYLHAEVEDLGDGWTLGVDALDREGHWSDAPRMDLTLVGPSGASERLGVPRTAPGRYALQLPTPSAGRYVLALTNGERSIRRVFHRAADVEMRSLSAAAALEPWLAAGLLQPWPQRSADWRFSTGQASTALRAWLLLALVGLYFAALVAPYRTTLQLIIAKRLMRFKREH